MFSSPMAPAPSWPCRRTTLRDHEFATKFDLPIRSGDCAAGPGRYQLQAYDGDGVAINSAFLDGLGVADAKERILQWLEEKGLGSRRVQYRLRDWLFSRQRYWGEPIPVLHRADGSIVAAARGCASLVAAGTGRLPPDGKRRAAARARRELGQDDGSELRGTGLARNQHHAAMGGLLLVLPALHRSEERQSPRRPGEGAVLDAGRPLCRRCRACRPAPSLCALLAQAALRHRRRIDEGAVPEALQPGDDPCLLLPGCKRQVSRAREDRPNRRQVLRRRRGSRAADREDVEVSIQRRQPRRGRGGIRRGFDAPLRDVHGPARCHQAVADLRCRGRAALPQPRLAPHLQRRRRTRTSSASSMRRPTGSSPPCSIGPSRASPTTSRICASTPRSRSSWSLSTR